MSRHQEVQSGGLGGDASQFAEVGSEGEGEETVCTG
jgi:hypothetical protein